VISAPPSCPLSEKPVGQFTGLVKKVRNRCIVKVRALNKCVKKDDLSACLGFGGRVAGHLLAQGAAEQVLSGEGIEQIRPFAE
jgi:hypothetical protein